MGQSPKRVQAASGDEVQALYAGECQPTEALQFLGWNTSRPALLQVTRSLRVHKRTGKTVICLLCPSHHFLGAPSCAVNLSHKSIVGQQWELTSVTLVIGRLT